jgi:hypothetical protein
VSKATRKYLERHAEPEARAINHFVSSAPTFGNALIIPNFDEGENLFDTLASIPASPLGLVLVILVINATPHSSTEARDQNQWTLRELKKRFPQNSAHSSLSFHEFPQGSLWVVDRTSPAYLLPEKEGVGLARKIGCDIALALRHAGKIHSNWIHTTDADVILSKDYFEKAEKVVDEEVSALVYPFTHLVSDEPRLAEAARLYEIHLRYYQAGLRWANSPYAFPTIGSTLAFRGRCYAEAGGFPARMAGEDFYLLNKLAKLGKVQPLAGTPLQILGRLSERVPFGTGKALGKILSDQREGSFSLYDPALFNHLKFWLMFLYQLTEKYNEKTNLIWREKVRSSSPFLSLDILREALEKMEAFEAIEEARTRSSHPSIFLRHLHTWFDAFRTLKLLHALRDRAFPSLPWREALSRAEFVKRSAERIEPEQILFDLANSDGAQHGS